MKIARRFPVGAEVHSEGVHFRIWAPSCQSMRVVINEKLILPLTKEKEGYFSLLTNEAFLHDLYQFQIDDDPALLPDPASRFQPQGALGPSQIIDPSRFNWTDSEWKGIPSMQGQSIYEMHVGTFTKEGTWRAAMEKLNELVELGITIIEMMPVADFVGEFGWGYDGINMYAPTRLYGTPDDLREFINQAHQEGIAVILDVVYNHFGPHADFMRKFSKHYLNDLLNTDWGQAINFDALLAEHVREYFIQNAVYWIQEFHFDGLRLDATQNIYDRSSPHILEEITENVHKCVTKRKTLVIAENESQEIKLVQAPKQGGFGMDAVWNDDFHHSALVRLTGRTEAYYSDYKGSVQEFVSAIKYGYLYQGQYYKWQKKARGTASLNIPHEKFIHFIENHDQIANSSRGNRIYQKSDEALFKLMTTVLLLSPQTPLLFQGEEFCASSPFYFFADHESPINLYVWEGRKQFMMQFPSFSHPDMLSYYPNPSDPNTFQACKLNWEEKKKEKHQNFFFLHKDLLTMRRNDAIFSSPQKIDGAVINEDVFLLRYCGPGDDDRLIVVNFGIDVPFNSVAEPLFAPPFGQKWKVIFYSQHPRYGGTGMPLIKEAEQILPGHAALVFESIRVV